MEQQNDRAGRDVMTWLRVDDAAADHPDIEKIGNEAFGAFVKLGCYCGRHNTDGHIPGSYARRNFSARSIAVLVEAGFLLVEEGDYRIANDKFLNVLAREVVEKRKAEIAKRVSDWRKRNAEGNQVTPGVTHGVTGAVTNPAPDPVSVSVSDPAPLQVPRKRETAQAPLALVPCSGSKPKDDVERRVLAYLNEKADKRYQAPTSGHLDAIRKALKRGWSEEDCQLVVNHKVAQWKGDPKMDDALKPVTIFARHPEYLEEARLWDERGRPTQNGRSRNGTPMTLGAAPPSDFTNAKTGWVE